MDKFDLYKLIAKVSGAINDSDKLSVPYLAAKASEHSKKMPHDKMIGQLSIVLASLNENNTGFITKKAFNDLFSKSYSNGSNAYKVFEKELSIVEQASTVKYASHSELPELQVEIKDDLLTTSLSDAFAGKSERGYSEVAGNRAVVKVAKSLNIWGMQPSNLFVSAGNRKYLVIQADYETPKGLTSVHIPVEVQDNNIVESFVFVGNAQPAELNNSNLKNYIVSNAGVKLSLSGQMLLGALDTISSKREMSGAEMALIRLNAKKQANSEFAANSIGAFSLDAVPVADVQVAKFEDTDSFAEKFANTYGDAVLKFGSDKVKLSRDVVVRELASIGYKNPQLKLSSVSKNSVCYSVLLGAVAFTTPVKIESNLVHSPSVVISNGSLYPFSYETIRKLHSEKTDYKAAAIASPLYELKASDLIESIRVAVAEKNLEKAEDALNVLSNTGTELDYMKGVKAFMSSLSVKESSNTKCSHIVKTSSSKYPVCAHTGLPLDKVYQDNHGHCRPKYRQSMDDTFEGVTTITSKVFL